MQEKDLLQLFEKMTLEDKIFEMLQLSPVFYSENAEETGPYQHLGISPDDVYRTGSVLGIYEGAERVLDIRREHYEKHPLHIPIMMMGDIIHGYGTAMPIPLAMGCSFDPELVRECYHNIAVESTASGVDVTFTPMVDLVRDARWGRVMESTGEDPYLNSEMCKAMVMGLQGENGLDKPDAMCACVKHFAAYGGAEAGREYNTVDVSERNLRQYYLPAYKAGVDADVGMIMTSFNTVAGVPSTVNKWLLRDLLRGEWGFDGVTISDWGSSTGVITHGVAADYKEAARLNIEAGLDIEMCTPCYIRELKNRVDCGEVDIELVNEAALRVLRLKNKLGLFENPMRHTSVEREKEVLRCDKHMDDAYKMVCASSVLLKNNGVLPISEKSGKVAFIGPYVYTDRFCSTWSGKASTFTNKTFFECADGKGDYLFAKGSHRLGIEQEREAVCMKYEIDDSDREQLLKDAIEVAKQADTVVMMIGELYEQSGEARSHTRIKIPHCQLELLREVRKVCSKVAVVLFNGRPLDLREVDSLSDAILEVWLPGSMGAPAIYDMVTGAVEPTGRLSMTFPYCVAQSPIYYSQLNTDHPYNGNPNNRFSSRYLDCPNEPLFAFGQGMGYTSFEYSDLTVEPILKRGGKITASVKVKNTGERRGTETVQLYIRDFVASISRPLKELKGFKKVTLDAGQEQTVSFDIDEEMLKYWNIDMEYVADAGRFAVYICHDSTERQYVEFKLQEE